jgi:type II secretory pathway pseudopilin PulG
MYPVQHGIRRLSNHPLDLDLGKNGIHARALSYPRDRKRLRFTITPPQIAVVVERVTIDMKLGRMMLLANRPSSASQGFAMVEVLMGIMLTFIFTMIATQAMVMATAIKVRGQELSEATNWIQADVESVKSLSNSLNYNSSTSTYTIDVSRCNATSSSSGYASNLQSQSSIGASNTIAKTSTLGNRPYTLRRVSTIKPVAPFNVLQLDYGVYKASDTAYTTPIAQFRTEVIPGASFSCR